MPGSTAAGAWPLLGSVAVLGPATLDAPRAPLTLASSLHPFGLPFTTPLPAGVLDAALEVRVHGDRFTAYDDVTGSSSWLRSGDRAWTQSAALKDAAELASSRGLRSGGTTLPILNNTVDWDKRRVAGRRRRLTFNGGVGGSSVDGAHALPPGDR